MEEELISKLDNSYTVRILKEMIGINSVVGREGELAEYLRRELEALGLRCETQEVEPGRLNVYAKLKGKRRAGGSTSTATWTQCPWSKGGRQTPSPPWRRRGGSTVSAPAT